ncbi:MAG: hypothetical protein RIC15_07475 [Vicingaceae bacterium]
MESKLPYIEQSPKIKGTIKMIVRRPDIDLREELESADLNAEEGIVGDSWKNRPSSKTEDGSPHPGTQLTLMNSRCIEMISPDRHRWKLAGDQFFVDLDLSDENLPAGSRLRLGTAEIEVSAIPHNGCLKFAERYGRDAVLFVNSKLGKKLHLRGLNATVIKSGKVRKGDIIELID